VIYWPLQYLWGSYIKEVTVDSSYRRNKRRIHHLERCKQNVSLMESPLEPSSKSGDEPQGSINMILFFSKFLEIVSITLNEISSSPSYENLALSTLKCRKPLTPLTYNCKINYSLKNITEIFLIPVQIQSSDAHNSSTVMQIRGCIQKFPD